jgi:hypothetical protein
MAATSETDGHSVPRWVRIGVAVAVTFGWLVSLIADIVLASYAQPAGLYVVFGVVAGGLFASEVRKSLLKGIKVSFDQDSPPP